MLTALALPPATATSRSKAESSPSAERQGWAGRREINASGLLVTPGWVDIHTHYDGQVSWDPYLSPSSWHGVTTVIIGNCGVGFAPVKRGQEDYLINLMVGVEDIPEATLAAGIDWQWESFGEYLDALSEKPARDRRRHPDSPLRGARLRDGRARSRQ